MATINKSKIENFNFPEWVTYTQAQELIKEMKEQFLTQPKNNKRI